MENDRPASGLDFQDDDAPGEIAALVAQDPPALQDRLVEALADPRRSVRVAAAFHLADLFQDVRAVFSLAEALDDDDRHVRKSAAEALWEIGDADTAALIALLEQSYGQDRERVAGALAWIGWQADDLDSEIAYLISARDWRGCVQLGGQAVPQLLAALADPDGAVRRAAAWALGQIADPAALDGLAALLADTEGDMFGVGGRVCDIAAEALGQIGTPEALDLLSQWGFGAA